MKKMILIIIFLFCMFVCNASIYSYLELSKIDIPSPYNNYHSLYLNIYNTTNVPNFKIIVNGTNVIFNWEKIGVFYSNVHISPIDAQNGQFVFKEGLLSRQPSILFGRLMYYNTSDIYSIKIISTDEFYLGNTYYPANYVIDSLSTPEPASICLLAFGIFFIRTIK